MGDQPTSPWEGLCTFVEEQIRTTGVPGVAVGVLQDGATNTAGFGVTSVENPLPVTGETYYQIGSITKTFTGTLIMRLVEAGKLRLDATVRTYLPEFSVSDEAASTQATVRHLLIHTAGWAGDHFIDTGPGEDALAKYVASMADLEQVSPVGEHFSYNNAGFALAGRLIEMVTGKRYTQALHELVLDPLGLPECYLDPGDVITHRFAVGHTVSADGAEVARPWPLPRCVQPMGGIACTVQDLLRYAQFHLGDGVAGDGTRLLTLESMQAMQSPQVAIREGESWGLTWSLEDVGGARTVGHGGGTTGQNTLLTLVPAHDFAIAVLTNADRGGQLAREATFWALEHYLGLKNEEPEPLETPAEELAQYAGWYRRPFADVELGVLGGRLVAQVIYKQGFPTPDQPPRPPPPPIVIGLHGKDALFVLDGPFKGTKADIVRRPDGSIGWLRMGRLFRRDD
jgi:CubicO group peptidase (beta-lactamase class C family)